jgi:pimeloyl-ACP methyl ester carboxylesterase
MSLARTSPATRAVARWRCSSPSTGRSWFTRWLCSSRRSSACPPRRRCSSERLLRSTRTSAATTLGAVAGFLSLVSGLDWDSCRGVIETHVPGGVAQAIADADTFFAAELPALGAWEFGPAEAAAIAQPVLSVKGSDTERLWVEVASLLRSWFLQAEELTIPGIGHLLQMQRSEPVARGVAGFLGRHPMATAEIGASPARGAGT